MFLSFARGHATIIIAPNYTNRRVFPYKCVKLVSPYFLSFGFGPTSEIRSTSSSATYIFLTNFLVLDSLSNMFSDPSTLPSYQVIPCLFHIKQSICEYILICQCPSQDLLSRSKHDTPEVIQPKI